MSAYVIRRLFLIVITILIASFLIYILLRSVPGNVIDVMLQRMTDQSGGRPVQVDRAALMHALGLDVPIFTQYGRWMGFLPGMNGSFSGIFEGNFGTSLWSGTPVIEMIGTRWPTTVELGIMAILVSNIIALPIGVYSALRQDSWGDYITRSFSILCIAIPGFWIGTMVIVFPSIWWGYMPPITLIPFLQDPIGNLKMFIVPAIVMGLGGAGMTMRMTRTMMLEVLRQDYIRTAWSKGLTERTIIIRHALKNAFIPVITLIGGYMPVLIGGEVIIEQIFMLPGMGRLLIDTTLARDYNVVGGIMFIMGVFLVINNLAVDLTYAYLDPRVHYK